MSWRGPLAVALLGTVASLGELLTPINWWPYPEHYAPKYVLLALSVGLGLSAVRSGRRVDRVLGVVALAIGGTAVVYVAWTLAGLIRS